jgi:hypothetical protein
MKLIIILMVMISQVYAATQIEKIEAMSGYELGVFTGKMSQKLQDLSIIGILEGNNALTVSGKGIMAMQAAGFLAEIYELTKVNEFELVISTLSGGKNNEFPVVINRLRYLITFTLPLFEKSNTVNIGPYNFKVMCGELSGKLDQLEDKNKSNK